MDKLIILALLYQVLTSVMLLLGVAKREKTPAVKSVATVAGYLPLTLALTCLVSYL